MFNQDETEMKFVINHWGENYSEGLVVHEFNLTELLKEIARRGYEKVTFDNLTEARLALGNAQEGGKLIYPPKVIVKEVIKEVPKPQPKRYEGAQNEHSIRDNTHAARERANESRTQKVVLAANDVNSPIFKEKNQKAQARFEEICLHGPVTYRQGKEDRGKTASRREELMAIRVVSRQQNKKGEHVPLYEEMVKLAEAKVRQFEADDTKRQMS